MIQEFFMSSGGADDAGSPMGIAVRIRIVAVFSLLCLVVPAGAALGEPFPAFLEAPEWNELPPNLKIEAREIELWGQIHTYLAQRGYELGSGVTYLFNNAVQRAAMQIQSLPQKLQRTRTNQALGNIRTIIDAMIYEVEQSEEERFIRYRIVGEEDFAASLRVLCPIWPFCN